MANKTELSRSINFESSEGGMSCGPCGGADVIDAEMVLMDEGKKVFLFAEWVSLVADEILHEAATESIYEIQLKTADFEDPRFDEYIKERDALTEAGVEAYFPGCDIKERYAEEFAVLTDMIKSEMAKNGYNPEDYFEDDEDEDE